MKLLSCMPLSCQEPSSNSCIFCLAIFYSTGSMCDFYHHKLVIFWEKMSECLRTYGPQIIRVPQLQSED